jgi:hypothetical protein
MSEEKAPYLAGQQQLEKFKVTLSRLELTVINRGLNLWLGELREKKRQATPGVS